MTVTLLSIIRLYQRFISPLLPRACRFQPSCSDYALTAIERFGGIHGCMLAGRRLLRCHPFTSGGHDPVPVSRADTATKACHDLIT